MGTLTRRPRPVSPRRPAPRGSGPAPGGSQSKRAADRAARRISITVHLPDPPERALRGILETLADDLAGRGIRADPSRTGPMVQEGRPAGRLALGRDRRSAEILWAPGGWSRDRAMRLGLRATAAPGGSRLLVSVRDPAPAWAENADDAAAWVAGSLLVPLVAALSPAAQVDWHADRVARRPSGPAAARTYRDPLYHWPNFLLILDRLHLSGADHLLEVGCGGGAFLARALQSGCSAVGIDHAPAMVRLASEVNAAAVADGRLRILQGEAEHLPVPDAAFSCAVMTGVFGFLPDPVAALAEIRRALRPGGRLLVFGTTPALRGTPAAPEPIASRFFWHEAGAYGDLARAAGFTGIAVEEPDLEPFARTAGLPEEAMPLFRGGRRGAVLLTARRPG